MISNKLFVIFSGYNFRAIVSFLRFATENELPFFVIARNQSDPIYQTDYKEKVIYERTDGNLSEILFTQISTQLFAAGGREFIILPSTEFLNRFLLQKREILEEMGFLIPLIDSEIYTLVSEKSNFWNLCRDRNFKVPEKIDIHFKICFPLVAKPKFYYSSKKQRYLSPYLIDSSEDWSKFLEIEDLDDFDFQEFIGGKSIYLLYYISKTGESQIFAQENLLQQPNGKSIVAARYPNIDTSEIASKYFTLLREIGFYGLIMIEVKYFDGKFYMIEANPRLWGPSQFFLDNGAGIFAAFVNDFGFLVKENRKTEYDKKYFWSGGLNMCKEKIVYHDFSQNEFAELYNEFEESDIFSRLDTIRWFEIEKNESDNQ